MTTSNSTGARVDTPASRSDQSLEAPTGADSHKRPVATMPNRTIRTASLALAALGCLWSANAMADFRLCNTASTRVSVSVSYTDGRAWVTEGWWNLKAGACEVLLRGPLAAQFYYVYAMDERGGEWKGKSFMCTRDREFRIEGRENCLVRGFERTGFFEVDTGRDAKNWTVQLTDANQPQAAR